MLQFAQAVVVALIAGVFSVFGVHISTKRQHENTITELKGEIKDIRIEFKNDLALINKDIASLEKKQDLHNGVIERMYCAEKAIEVIEERQKTANHRIDDLEAK